MLLILVFLAAGQPQDVKPGPGRYLVAVDGRDSWSGTLPAPNDGKTDGPFATLERARDAVRELKRTAGGLREPVTVRVRGGRYQLARPLTFTPEDSGAEGRPITYCAYPGETPVISGGVRIEGWRKHDERLWVADVPWVKERKRPFHQLFVNGVRRTRARMPNQGSY
ncbi:MAG: hypothetical protein FJ272_18250, partial [Planctomycetes bacterium]|nr:hypothetical protein [Planctomycetota bacterium]